MDTGRFDVFHQAADDHVLFAVAKCIDIHFHGIFQVLINQHRVIRLHLHGFAHVAIELLLVEHHLHGTTTEHIRRTHNDGIADAAGNGAGLRFAAG